MTSDEDDEDDEDHEPRIEPLVLNFDFGKPERMSNFHHGTEVAALAGGNTIGIAKKSTLVGFSGLQSYAPDPRRPGGSIFNSEYYLHGILAVIDDITEFGGARDYSILNMSWGVLRTWVPEVYGDRLSKPLNPKNCKITIHILVLNLTMLILQNNS